MPRNNKKTLIKTALLAALLSSITQLAHAQFYHPGWRSTPPPAPVVSMELTTAEGKPLLLETSEYGGWSMPKDSPFKNVREIPRPTPYVVVFERSFIIGKYRYISVEKLERAEKSGNGKEWVLTFDGGKQLTAPYLRFEMCPSADEPPVPNRCASAYLREVGYQLYSTDTPAVETGEAAELRLLAGGTLRGLSAAEAKERKDAIRARLAAVAQQENLQKRQAADERQRKIAQDGAARDEVKRRNLAILDKAAHGGQPTGKLLSRMQDMAHNFIYSYDDPCHIDSHNGAWNTGNGGLDARELDVSGMANVQIERYVDPYVNGEQRRVRYVIFPGSNLRYEFDRQDYAQEGVRILRELRNRCMAVHG